MTYQEIERLARRGIKYPIKALAYMVAIPVAIVAMVFFGVILGPWLWLDDHNPDIEKFLGGAFVGMFVSILVMSDLAMATDPYSRTWQVLGVFVPVFSIGATVGVFMAFSIIGTVVLIMAQGVKLGLSHARSELRIS